MLACKETLVKQQQQQQQQQQNSPLYLNSVGSFFLTCTLL